MRSIFGGPVRGHIQVELLSAYLDKQASPAERASIDAHLQQCTACRAELEGLRRTVVMLHALPRVAVPRAFTLSEVQVGSRRPNAAPGWFGGFARGLGAVAAIAVVAFVALTVLRPEQAPWNPGQIIARVEPTTVVATEEVALAPMAPAATEAPLAKTQEQAPTAVVEPPPEVALATASTPEPEQPAVLEAAPTIAIGPSESAADLVGAAASAPEATVDAATAPLLAAKAAPTEAAPEMAAAAMGRGGGGADEPVGIPSEFLTPEPTPFARPLATALPSGIRFAYADLNALWAVDREGGARQLVQAHGINTPQLSPDQTWIAYRIPQDAGLQVWAVRWAGGEPKLLLDDAKLPADRLPTGYVRRAIRDTRWTPQGDTLSVSLTLAPDPQQPDLPLRVELWRIDVETGALRFVNELGRANQPYDSPDGSQYLLVQYGTEASPEGSVSLHDAASGKGQTVLTFPASPGKNNYESQVSWAPDGKAAWVAIPEPDYGVPTPPNGATLYTVSGAGKANKIGQVDAFQVYWSPGGKLLAYTRFISKSLAMNELYLADEDGANPQLYTTMTQGEFISWSPQGDRFLYQNNYQVFVGEPGQAPQRLANSVSMVGPRWVSDTQVMALHDTGDGWLLTLRDVTGDAVGLLPLPREAMWDIGR